MPTVKTDHVRTLSCLRTANIQFDHLANTSHLTDFSSTLAGHCWHLQSFRVFIRALRHLFSTSISVQYYVDDVKLHCSLSYFNLLRTKLTVIAIVMR